MKWVVEEHAAIGVEVGVEVGVDVAARGRGESNVMGCCCRGSCCCCW